MTEVSTHRVVVAFCDGSASRLPLGSYWRFTAKKTDFYLEPLGKGAAGVHLSAHGPREGFPSHRFHIKINKADVQPARERGYFLEHNIPDRGLSFSGRPAGDRAFLVARMRWTRDLRDPSYLYAARSRQSAPELGDGIEGALLNEPLGPGKVWDLDVFVAYGAPYWPKIIGPTIGTPHLPPLVNGSGMHMTVISTQRLLANMPTPPDLVQPRPAADQTPNQLQCGGLDEAGDMYWWVETIVARELLYPSGESGDTEPAA